MSPGVVLENPTVSQTLSTSYGPPSTLSTQCIELPPAASREAVTKPFREPELAFGEQDTIVKDGRSTPKPTEPRKEQPRDGAPVVYPHLEQQWEPPPSRLPEAQKRGASKRLNSFLLSMFKPSGKTQTEIASSSPLGHSGT